MDCRGTAAGRVLGSGFSESLRQGRHWLQHRKLQVKSDSTVRLIIESKGRSISELRRIIPKTLAPDLTWSIGEIIPPARIPKKTNGLRVSSGLPASQIVQKHIGALVDKIGRLNWGRLRHDCTALITCAIYAAETIPSLYLETSLISKIAELRLDLDFDVYLIGEEEEEP
jgi:hypothetical protein